MLIKDPLLLVNVLHLLLEEIPVIDPLIEVVIVVIDQIEIIEEMEMIVVIEEVIVIIVITGRIVITAVAVVIGKIETAVLLIGIVVEKMLILIHPKIKVGMTCIQ